MRLCGRLDRRIERKALHLPAYLRLYEEDSLKENAMDNYKRLKPFESGLFTNLINQKYKLVPKPPLELQVVEAKAKGLTLVSRTDHRCYGFYKIDECGHDVFLHYGAVRKMHMGSKPKCHTCMLKKHVADANKKSLTFIKYTTTCKSEAMYANQKCNHLLIAKINNVNLSEYDSYRCSTCFEERLVREVTKVEEDPTVNYTKMRLIWLGLFILSIIMINL